MIEKIKHLLKTTGNNLKQFRSRNIFSVMIICFSFLIVGIFVSLSNNLRTTARSLSDNMLIAFFLEKTVDQKQVKPLIDETSKLPFVKEIRFVTAAQALETFKQNFPELRDLVSNLKTNPFPASIEVRIKSDSTSSSEVARFVENFRTRPGITDVQYNQDWIDRIKAFNRVAQALGVFLGSILILASFFIISNVIKLNVFARKNEIEILRLVGATNNFIRLPFWLEGIILGLLGSLTSLLLLFLVIKIFPLYIGPSLGAIRTLLSFQYPNHSQILWILAGGAVTGFIGSASAVSKFLKV